MGGSHCTTDDPKLCMLLGLTFFVIHVILHSSFVRFVVPATKALPKPPTESYSDAVTRTKGATYLNTNPVEVLKSLQSPKTGASAPHPLTFYCIGKEHLQPDSFQKYDNYNCASNL